MNYGSDGLSASDVALLTGNNRSSGSGDGFGNGEGAWWIIIFLIFAFLGFGRNGYGGNGNSGDGNGSNGGGGTYMMNPLGFSACCTPATQQGLSDAFSFNQLDNSIRATQNGLCDGFYAMNSAISGLGSSLLQCCCETKSAIANANYDVTTNMNSNTNAINMNLVNGFNSMTQGIHDLSYQNQKCCCDIERGIEGVNYNMSKNTCDIIQAGNANTQRIIDTLTQNEITALRTDLQSAQLQLSNSNQTQTILNQLKPTPMPSYIVANPYCNCNCGCNPVSCGV